MTDQSFLQAIFADPSDEATWLVYADWLDDRGDPRAEFLRLKLAVRAARRTQPQRLAAYRRMLDLRPSVDPTWASVIDDGEGWVREVRPARVRVDTQGPAPRKYGPNAVRVWWAEMNLLLREGWRNVAVGRRHLYVVPPEGLSGQDPVVTLMVPMDAEIERLGLGFRHGTRMSAGFLGRWYLRFDPADAHSPARFRIEYGMSWSVRLTWDRGVQSPPVWSRVG